MQVTLDIPDALAAPALLEALLVEGYRTRVVSEGQIRRALGYGTPMQVHALLQEHNVPLDYTTEDLEQDRETLRQFHELETATVA